MCHNESFKGISEKLKEVEFNISNPHSSTYKALYFVYKQQDTRLLFCTGANKESNYLYGNYQNTIKTLPRPVLSELFPVATIK
jgi:hypothetical protein